LKVNQKQTENDIPNKLKIGVSLWALYNY